MTADYTFIPRYSLSSSFITLGDGRFWHNSYDAARRKSYGWVAGYSGIASYDWATDTVIQEGIPSGFAGSLTGTAAYDPIGDFLYVANNASPGIIYKLNAANLGGAIVGSYTMPAGGVASLAFSQTSNLLCASGNATFRIINAGTMTLSASSGSGNTSLSTVWTPQNNEFISTPGIRYVTTSGGVTVTFGTGVAGVTHGIYYSPASQRVYTLNTNSPFQIWVVNPATRTVESTYNYSANPFGGIFYFHSVRRICVLGTGEVAMIDPVTQEISRTQNGAFTAIRCLFGEESSLSLRPYVSSDIRRISLASFVPELTAIQTFSSAALLSGSLPTDNIYFPSSNVVVINATVDYFELDAQMTSASNSATVYDIDWVRTGNTQASTSSALRLSGNSEIQGDCVVTIASGGTLRLGTRSTYNERFVFQSGSRLEVSQNVSFPNFSFTGTTIDNLSSSNVTIEVTSAQASGLTIESPTTGGGSITLQAPVQTYVRAVTGLPIGAKVFLARRSSPGFALLNEFTLAAGNNSGNSTIVVSSAIPADKPASGFVRVFDNNGIEDRYAYTSWSGSTFTLSGTLSKTYAAGNSCYVPYIDATAGSATISTSLLHVANRDVVLVVRKGSSSPIQDFVSNYTLTSQDSSVTVTNISDLINNL